MGNNIVPFSPRSTQSRASTRGHGREKEDALQQDTERRRAVAEEVERRLADLSEGKRGPAGKDPSDKIQLATNLEAILTEIGEHKCKRATVLDKAGLSNPEEESTKFLYQYTLPAKLSEDKRKARINRLSGVVMNYVRLAKSAGVISKKEEFWYLDDLFRGTTYEPRAANVTNDYAWRREFSDLLAALAQFALAKHGDLDAYLDDLRCGYLGWHPTLGFGEFDSLHQRGPVQIRDRVPVPIEFLGFVPTIHLYDECLGSASFENIPLFLTRDYRAPLSGDIRHITCN